MAKLLAHELSHVISRKRPEIRGELYKLIGYISTSCIDFPKELKSRRLTNPDAYYDNIYIEVLFKGQKIKVHPIVTLKEDYQNIDCNKDILKSISMKFLEIERKRDRWQTKYENRRPIYLDLEEISGFFEKVGKNVKYNIEPDEIIAENFTMLLFEDKELPSPEIVIQIRDLLMSKEIISIEK